MIDIDGIRQRRDRRESEHFDPHGEEWMSTFLWSDIDNLLAEVDRLRAEVDRLRAELAHLMEGAGYDSCAEYVGRSLALATLYDACVDSKAELLRQREVCVAGNCESAQVCPVCLA